MTGTWLFERISFTVGDDCGSPCADIVADRVPAAGGHVRNEGARNEEFEQQILRMG